MSLRVPVTQPKPTPTPLGIATGGSAGAAPKAQGPARGVADPFADIYEGHFHLVFRTLQRFGVPVSQLDDALQDVFLVVCRNLASFRGESSLKTWIIGITLRVATSYVRKLRRVAEPLETAGELCDERSPDPLESASRSEAVTALYAALGGLDVDKRAVFILAELEQLSVPEIAEIVGVNVNTAASRLRAARRQFEQMVQRMRARDEWKAVLP